MRNGVHCVAVVMLLLAADSVSMVCARFQNVNIVCCVRATRSEDESPEVR